MDGENNFDSDTSESWSVIDINDSEHGIDLAVDASTIPVKCESSTSENIVEPSSQQNEGVQTADSASITSDPLNVTSSTEHTKENQDFQVLYKGKVFQNDYDLEKKSSECNCSKSSLGETGKIEAHTKFIGIDNDSDSISVISESECNDLKCSAYETDEIWEEKLSKCNLPAKTHPNVLNRKRKRLKLNFRESSEESVSSDFMIPDGNFYTNIQSVDFKKSNSELQVKEYQSTPVYRHYRNNVANTVLSLAMGVIFTGVACIAIGHFLGVHDAQHTAGEMMETLRRLQMENVLLHTRLAQLSRAFFTRGNNKLELRAKDDSQNCLNNYFVKHERGSNENGLPQVDAMENSILLPERHGGITRRTKFSSDGLPQTDFQNMDKENILKQAHDQSNYFKIYRYENNYLKAPYSTTTPIKAPVVFKKNSPSEESFEGHGKILKPSYEMVHKKHVKHLYDVEGDCNVKRDESKNLVNSRQNCLAVREKDLIRFRWFLIQKKKKERKDTTAKKDYWNSTIRDGTPVYLYKFPQPEKYYKYENKNSCDKESAPARQWKLKYSCDDLKFTPSASNFDLNIDLRNSTSYISKESSNKVIKRSSKTKKEKNKEKENITKQCDSNCKDSSCKKAQKRHTKPLTKNAKGNYEKFFRKYKNVFKKNSKRNECRKKGAEECDFKPGGIKQSKATYKKKDDDEKYGKRGKEKCGPRLKVRKLNRKNIFPYLYKKTNGFRSKKMMVFDARPHIKSANQTGCEYCANKTTGNWLYRWAEGREKYRRNQKISGWQFDRAKNRQNSRIGDADWQFSRALERESRRNNEGYMYFRKKDPRYSQQKEFSDAYSWI